MGKNKLRKWMDREAVSVATMAKDLGVAASTVYALRAGTTKPGLGLAVKIEVATGIPVEYWA